MTGQRLAAGRRGGCARGRGRAESHGGGQDERRAEERVRDARRPASARSLDLSLPVSLPVAHRSPPGEKGYCPVLGPLAASRRTGASGPRRRAVRDRAAHNGGTMGLARPESARRTRDGVTTGTPRGWAVPPPSPPRGLAASRPRGRATLHDASKGPRVVPHVVLGFRSVTSDAPHGTTPIRTGGAIPATHTCTDLSRSHVGMPHCEFLHPPSMGAVGHVLVFTFPGQGSQRAGMGEPWVDHPSWEVVEEASAAAERDLSRSSPARPD